MAIWSPRSKRKQKEAQGNDDSAANSKQNNSTGNKAGARPSDATKPDDTAANSKQNNSTGNKAGARPSNATQSTLKNQNEGKSLVLPSYLEANNARKGELDNVIDSSGKLSTAPHHSKPTSSDTVEETGIETAQTSQVSSIPKNRNPVQSRQVPGDPQNINNSTKQPIQAFSSSAKYRNTLQAVGDTNNRINRDLKLNETRTRTDMAMGKELKNFQEGDTHGNSGPNDRVANVNAKGRQKLKDEVSNNKPWHQRKREGNKKMPEVSIEVFEAPKPTNKTVGQHHDGIQTGEKEDVISARKLTVDTGQKLNSERVGNDAEYANYQRLEYKKQLQVIRQHCHDTVVELNEEITFLSNELEKTREMLQICKSDKTQLREQLDIQNTRTASLIQSFREHQSELKQEVERCGANKELTLEVLRSLRLHSLAQVIPEYKELETTTARLRSENKRMFMALQFQLSETEGLRQANRDLIGEVQMMREHKAQADQEVARLKAQLDEVGTRYQTKSLEAGGHRRRIDYLSDVLFLHAQPDQQSYLSSSSDVQSAGTSGRVENPVFTANTSPRPPVVSNWNSLPSEEDPLGFSQSTVSRGSGGVKRWVRQLAGDQGITNNSTTSPRVPSAKPSIESQSKKKLSSSSPKKPEKTKMTKAKRSPRVTITEQRRLHNQKNPRATKSKTQPFRTF